MGDDVLRARLLVRGGTWILGDLDDVAAGKRAGNKGAGRVRNIERRIRIAVILRQELIITVGVLAALAVLAGHRDLLVRRIGCRAAGRLRSFPVLNRNWEGAGVGVACG